MPKIKCGVCRQWTYSSSRCIYCSKVFCKKHKRPERHDCIMREPHARHEIYENEDYFVCERGSAYSAYWPPWYIPRHLSEAHKIPRKRQEILGWNEKYKKEYLENIDRPIEMEVEPDVVVDTTSPEEYKKEEERIKKELKAKRDSR